MNARTSLLLLSVAITVIVLFSQRQATSFDSARHVESHQQTPLPAARGKVRSENRSVDDAFSTRAHNVQVEGAGIVVKVLRDDVEGSRHQKFLLRLPSGLTILIAHNIDLASRVEDLHAGDTVQFNGDYEWSEKGGVVHWTHRDPSGRHVAGWLKHNGRRYQ